MKKLNHRQKNSIHSSGFTILELIIVVVIIGILAAVTIATYIGTIPSSRDTSVQSDIDTMDALQTNYGVNTMRNAVSGKAYYSGDGYDATLGFRPSGDDVIDVVINSSDYCIRGFNTGGTKNSIWNAYTKESSPGICDNQLSPSVDAGGSSCPTGFIRVPGSNTYGTNDFCIMKYEAKNVGGVAASQAASTPWIGISQTDSITASDAACPGCHLISEARWLTIAQNVLSVAINWDNGAGGHTVGTGYIYSGHNDNAPANSLAAAADNDPYNGTGQVPPSNQKRTLTLSNGEIIWDLAGNVYEWTSGTSTTGQPGGAPGAGDNWRQWTAITNSGTLSPNPFPATTNISGASGWNSGNGIGQIYSNADEVDLRGFIRGGDRDDGGAVGVLALNLSNAPSDTHSYIGFRVSR